MFCLAIELPPGNIVELALCEGKISQLNNDLTKGSVVQRSDTLCRDKSWEGATTAKIPTRRSYELLHRLPANVSDLRPECVRFGVMYFRWWWLLNWRARSDGTTQESSPSSLSWKSTRIPGSGSRSDWGCLSFSLKRVQIWAADSWCGSHRLLFRLRPTVMPWNLSGENFWWRGNSLLRCFILGRFRRRCFLLWVFGATAVSVRNPLFRSVSVTEKSFRSAAN